jgi:hypothetical protein
MTTQLAPSLREGVARPASVVREHRAAATAAGILYITGTVAGILSRAITYIPVHDADDPLAYAAKHSTAVTTGALLLLVMGLSLAFVPVVLFPVLRRVNEVLATGYLILRGAVETAAYVIVAVAWLLLVPVADAMSAGPATSSSAGVQLGRLLVESAGASTMLSLVFCLAGVLFYVLLYQAQIVPRWIAVWGLVAIPFYVAGALLAVYGTIGGDSAQMNLLDLPLAVQEMVLGVWMIARGFRPASSNTPTA